METSNEQLIDELIILLIKVCKYYGVKITREKTYNDLIREIINKLSREELEEYLQSFEDEKGQLCEQTKEIALQRLEELKRKEQRVNHHSAANIKPVPNFITC